MGEVLYYRYDEEDPKNIDEYVDKLVLEVSFLYEYIVCVSDWFNNCWLPKANLRREKYKEYKEATSILGRRNYFFTYFNFQSIRYQYFIYIRAFFDTLKIYLKKSTTEYRNNPKEWESSQYLKYYVHLIFKTGFYKQKIFTDEEILEEIKRLNSFLSKPLHAFPIYYEKLNNFNTILFEEVNEEDKQPLKDVILITNLILKKWINEMTIKHPIDPNVKGSEQEYLKYTSYLKTNVDFVKNNLDFWQDKCLEEFDNKIKEMLRSMKNKTLPNFSKLLKKN